MIDGQQAVSGNQQTAMWQGGKRNAASGVIYGQCAASLNQAGR